MNLNYAFVFLFVFIGLFAVLVGLITSDFFVNQTDYISPYTQDKEVAEYFSANNITLYANQWSFYIEAAYGGNMEALEDVPVTDDQIEFWFVQDIYGSNTVHVRHAFPYWFWMGWHYMYPTEGVKAILSAAGLNPYLFNWAAMEALAIDTNSSTFEVACDHVTMNFVILNTGNYSTLEECWDNDEISVLSSYEIDFDAMKPSAWTLVAQLLTFQAPNLGLPEPANTIFSYILGAGIWAVIALLIFALVTSVIPTIAGWKT